MDIVKIIRAMPDIVKAALVLPALWTALVVIGFMLAPHAICFECFFFGLLIAMPVLAVFGVAVLLAVKAALLVNKRLSDQLRR